MKTSGDYPLFVKLLFLFPLAVFCIFLGYFAVDVPQGDDFALILHFLSNYVSTGNDYTQKINLLTAQFVEHRLLYTRLVVLFQYLLTGKVSFYLIIFLGNLSLLGIFVLCWRQLKTARYSLLYLLPISLLLFQPCYSYDGVLWPAATLAYNSVSFFALLTIHWLSSRRPVHFWLAVVSAALCTYTFGNGMLVLLAGAGLLIVQKRWKPLIIWIGISVLIGAVYFHEYLLIQSRNNPLDNLSTHTLYVAINFFIFLGSALNWDDAWPKFLTLSDLNSLVGGIIVFGFAGYVFYLSFVSLFSTIRRNNTVLFDFLFGGFVFFVLTGLLVSVSRVNEDSLLLHINRYRINSVVVLLLSYLTLIPFFEKHRRFYRLVPIGLTGFCLLSYFHFYAVFSEYKRTYSAGKFNWVNAHEWFIYRDTSYWEKASEMVTHQARQKLGYQIASSPFSQVISEEKPLKELKIKKSEAEKSISVEGYPDSAGFLGWGKDYYLAFRNVGQATTYLAQTHYNRRSIRYFLMGQPYYYPVFHANLSYRHFPTGKYQVGIALAEKNKLEICWQPVTFHTVQESNVRQ
ncbi:MAG: hypothetical protein U0X91_17380 [Spirosomataceae bacterium]